MKIGEQIVLFILAFIAGGYFLVRMVSLIF